MIFTERFCCSTEDVKYGFKIKVVEDAIIIVIFLVECIVIVNEGTSTLVKESTKRWTVLAYFKVFCEYFMRGFSAARN